MFKHLAVYFFIVCLSPVIVQYVTGQVPKDKCHLDQHYVPYVRLHKKATGPSIAEQTTRGFLDMREYIHKFACINGPVIIYQSVMRNEDQDIIFTDAQVKMFVHDCFIVNQIKSTKVTELQGKGVKRLNMIYVDPWDVVGQSAAGIFLLSNSGDYRAPVPTFMANDNLDFSLSMNEKEGVTGGSFATIGVGPFCLRVDNVFDVIVSGPPGSDSVCHWSLSGSSTKSSKAFTKRYHKIFNGKRKLSQYAWGVCPGGSGLEPIPMTPRTTTQATVTYEPFAIINPMYKSKMNFEAIENNAVTIRTDPSPDIREFNNIGYSDETDDYDLYNPPDFHITIDPEDCFTFPPKPTEVPSTCDPGGLGDSCFFMGMALGKPPSPGPPVSPPILDKELTWKRDILSIAAEVFGHICEPFSPDMPYTVARFFEYYLAKAHELNPEIPTMPREKWKYITAEFSRCMTDITKTDSRMLWYWDSVDERETFGPDLKYQERYLDEPSPNCKAVECSDGCEPVDDKCMPFLDLEEYCSSLGVRRCRENITICYHNRETDTCDLGLECEALHCPDGELAKCMPEGDRCMETHTEKVDFDSAKAKQEALDRENRINLLEEDSDVQSTNSSNGSDPAGGVGLGNDEIKPQEDPIDTDTEPDTGNSTITETGKANQTGDGEFPEYDDFQAMALGGGPINPTFPRAEFRQEVFPEKSLRKYNYDGYPKNIMLITNIIVEDFDHKKTKFQDFSRKKRRKRDFPPDDSTEKNHNHNQDKNNKKRKQQPTTVLGECIYFYEEAAEATFDLNVVIDVFWKIYATAIGYCNKHFGMRKSETFPNLYSMFVEDFVVHIEDEWRWPKDNEGLKMIFHELSSERGQRWLDVCLESSYVISNSTTYRPPRPIKLGNGRKTQQNYFLQLPDYLNENYMWAGDGEYVAVSCPN